MPSKLQGFLICLFLGFLGLGILFVWLPDYRLPFLPTASFSVPINAEDGTPTLSQEWITPTELSWPFVGFTGAVLSKETPKVLTWVLTLPSGTVVKSQTPMRKDQPFEVDYGRTQWTVRRDTGDPVPLFLPFDMGELRALKLGAEVGGCLYLVVDGSAGVTLMRINAQNEVEALTTNLTFGPLLLQQPAQSILVFGTDTITHNTRVSPLYYRFYRTALDGQPVFDYLGHTTYKAGVIQSLFFSGGELRWFARRNPFIGEQDYQRTWILKP